MPTINNVGSGYFNYYHQRGRYETTDGKAKEVWYNKDLSKEEIGSNNSGVLNRESENADLYRKLDAAYADIAASNRARYSTTDELETAIYWKYFAKDSAYSSYSREERNAMYNNEISMTEFGYINSNRISIPDLLKDPHLNGEVTKNTSTSTRAFNENTLSQQINNVFSNNGIDISLFGNTKFRFAVNGFTNKLMVSALSIDSKAALNIDTIRKMTEALNSNDNAKNLFYNLLYDGTRQGTHDKAQLAKWSLYSNFNKITGLDIRNFNQTSSGFIDNDGNSARDIFKTALQTTSCVPTEFKGAAYDYFVQQERNAMSYNMNSTPDLTLALEYQNGSVTLPNKITAFDVNV